jgi:hypothetical protein
MCANQIMHDKVYITESYHAIHIKVHFWPIEATNYSTQGLPIISNANFEERRCVIRSLSYLTLLAPTHALHREIYYCWDLNGLLHHHCGYINLYFLCFPTRVDIAASECSVGVVEGLLGAEASVDEPGDTASKLNLKRADHDDVEGAVATGLLTDTQKLVILTFTASYRGRKAGPTKEVDVVNRDMEQGHMSSRVCFDVIQEALDGNVSIVWWNSLLHPVLVRVEVCLDRKDRECTVVLVMKRVLRGIHFEEAICFVGVDSGAGDINVCVLSHIIGFCQNKLVNKLSICLHDGKVDNAPGWYPQPCELCLALWESLKM